MSRQAITWIVIFAVLALIVIVRSFFGHGMGRIYVKEVSHAYVQADVPDLRLTDLVEDDSTVTSIEPRKWA